MRYEASPTFKGGSAEYLEEQSYGLCIPPAWLAAKEPDKKKRRQYRNGQQHEGVMIGRGQCLAHRGGYLGSDKPTHTDLGESAGYSGSERLQMGGGPAL